MLFSTEIRERSRDSAQSEAYAVSLKKMKKLKCEIYRDSMQNYKKYAIPPAQLIIADVPYNVGKNFYGSNPMWYNGGDNKNGESKLAGKAAFNSDFNFNLYEIYFINLWKPPLNIDDKCKDELTIQLPDTEWKIFTTPLWNKWEKEVSAVDKEYQMRNQEKAAKFELDRIMRRKWHSGEITEEEYYKYLDCEEDRNTANIRI